MNQEKSRFLKITAAAAYLVMITVNGLANGLPINNRSTGEISDAYPNLFAPAGITFSIWGLIYGLLAAYVVYQFLPISRNKREIFDKINPYFIATSLFNVVWIFTWHYDFIGFSLLLMALLLTGLIKVADILRTEKFVLLENIFVRLPFSIYFGWISIATIANATVFLVSVNWQGFGWSAELWTVLVILVGAVIGLWRMRQDKNIPYGLVFIWAYLGIIIKHVASSGFNAQYIYVISAAGLSIALFIYWQIKLAQERGSWLDRIKEKF